MPKWMKVAIVGLAVLALLMPALPAFACSCAYGDPRDRLNEADAAIIGTLLESHPVDPPVEDSGEDTIYTFTVDEEVKGDFGDTLEVHAPYSGASCGIEVGIGQQTGLFLEQREDGTWGSGLCSQIAPDELREAAEPLPAPDGEQPVRLVIGGNWGEVDHVALDSDGRTVAYGWGETAGGQLEVCPGAEHFLQLYQPIWGERIHHLRVRSFDDDSIVRTVEVPIGRYSYAVEVTCFDADANEVLVASTREGGRRGGRIFRVGPSGAELLYEGRPLDAVFPDTDTAILSTGRNLTRLRVMDLTSGETSLLAEVPPNTGGLALSPSGRRLAAFAYSESEPKVVSVGLEGGRVRTSKIGLYGCGRVEWSANEIVYLPGGCDDSRVRVFDAKLTTKRALDGDWYTSDNSVIDGVVYGMGWGVLYRVVLEGSTTEVLREFPAPELFFVEAVPDAPQVEWPASP